MVELSIDEFIFKATESTIIDTVELMNKIYRRCHKIILTAELLRHFQKSLDMMQRRARDEISQYVVKLYKSIFFDRLKREVRAGARPKEIERNIRDKIDLEVIAAALSSSDKIFVTTDENLIDKVREKNLTKTYGLRPYSLREALNIL